MSATAVSAKPAGESEDRRAVRRGLGLVTLAMIVLPGQDAIAKYLADTVPLGQINWARFLLQTLFIVPFILFFQGASGLLPNRFWPNIVRGALIAASSLAFFTAIKFMPLADALAIFFVEPFILIVLSALIDKEQVSRGRKIAVLAGFVGVVMVVRPSYAVLGWISLLPAAAGFGFAVYVLLTRRFSAFDTPLTMQFTAGASALAVMTAALALGSFAGWPELSLSPVGPGELSWLLLMGLFGTAGHLLFVHAAQLAPSSLIAPMQYIEIAVAALLGYIVFGDFPDFWKWIGIAVIVASGVAVIWGESRR